MLGGHGASLSATGLGVQEPHQQGRQGDEAEQEPVVRLGVVDGEPQEGVVLMRVVRKVGAHGSFRFGGGRPLLKNGSFCRPCPRKALIRTKALARAARPATPLPGLAGGSTWPRDPGSGSAGRRWSWRSPSGWSSQFSIGPDPEGRRNLSGTCELPTQRQGPYSTVTLLARLRGWSTSQPRRTAMWYASSCRGTA